MSSDKHIDKIDLAEPRAGSEGEFSRGYTAHPLDVNYTSLSTPPTEIAMPSSPAPNSNDNQSGAVQTAPQNQTTNKD